MYGRSIVLIRPHRFEDERGWFAETYNEKQAGRWGITARFVQDNHSHSRRAGTVRGLHFQSPPHQQTKFVRCIRGRIFDVVVDIRRGSPTFGRHLSFDLAESDGLMLYVPPGFAHGFMTLEPDTEVVYKVSEFYAPDCDHGIVWNDAIIGIGWPQLHPDPHLSPRDRALPSFDRVETPFRYDGAPLPASAAAVPLLQ